MLPSEKSISLKCKVCEQWFDSKADRSTDCPHCGFQNSQRLKADPDIALESKPFSLDLNKSLLPYKKDDFILLRLFKRMVNLLFMGYLLIMALLAYLAASLAG